jgi:DNA polymerase-3 subunit epsilon
VFSAFNEPSIPIPEEVVELTHITDEMVAGHRIDPDAVAAFVSEIFPGSTCGENAMDRVQEWPIFAHEQY